ncbi:MAG TPA: hypothetical protein VFU19_09155 [Iamia sp.]|nr:hypothetical protein [Iamia sp.]
MDEIRIALRATTRRIVTPALLVALTVIAGLAPMVHLASASVAPIVHEDAALRATRTADEVPARHRRVARRRTRRRPLLAALRAAVTARPGRLGTVPLPTTQILRL